ncbi:uncharacterized protein LOC123891232 isoform X2 [Trifolium pratense]|uniref:uncharacterized protein LOC123891232 isoform X2 n=1 Tax=Trifolium pratense TaxID=57577 RepID=UPI001E6909DE|nr:uncharacterized protein LOC123891232 isoform X2 [Trifolium pratense]
MRRWKRWEEETKTPEYQFSHDPERFRFAGETSFGKRHLSFWTKKPVLIWIVCFFRQFVRSVPEVDYLTLMHGFIMQNNYIWYPADHLISGGFVYKHLCSSRFKIQFIYNFVFFYRDEGVHCGIQDDLYLSRSTVVYFKPNDMDSLQETLENITSKYKHTKNLSRYIVVEALYQVRN